MGCTINHNQYKCAEAILQQVNREIQKGSMTYGSISGLGFSEFMRRAQVTESEINAEGLDNAFEESARFYNVPVNLLKAIGKAESNFDPYAQSAAGAQGVMQLMPETARSLGVTDVFDARSNIMGGAKYISDLLKQYNGDIDLALAAYNAGSGNVEKYGGVPPFPETVNYIRKVKEYMGTTLQADENIQSEGKIQCSLENQAGAADMALWLSELFRLQIQSRILTLTPFDE
ncbi:lytic transglycosylase domain-containing protein [Mediterraneibacter agrestimuris]|uniref:lytic transglycosylase domain-containing protein n=1 Tax=Mediterraneibacter agrestimuris TaxID=2941333 RepID=UPI00203F63E5|nr:lytic transglycosylase domain-containing protein [Mediterraneibacter agrestimuris]